MRTLALAICSAFLLAACAQTPQPTAFPPISFTDRAALAVDAPRIQIVEQYASPLRAPHIEQDLPVAPMTLVKAWFRDRLKAQGKGGEFRAIIKEASVISEDLPKKGGIEGALGRQQAVNLTGRFEVLLEFSRKNGAEANVTVNVSRSRTLTEGLSPIERDKAYYAFMKDLGDDLSRELQTNMENNMREALL
jgi:hypothetical protein